MLKEGSLLRALYLLKPSDTKEKRLEDVIQWCERNNFRQEDFERLSEEGGLQSKATFDDGELLLKRILFCHNQDTIKELQTLKKALQNKVRRSFDIVVEMVRSMDGNKKNSQEMPEKVSLCATSKKINKSESDSDDDLDDDIGDNLEGLIADAIVLCAGLLFIFIFI